MGYYKTKTTKSSCVALFALTLIWITICPASAEKLAHSGQGASYQGQLLIENGMVSADLEEVSLRIILEQIRKQANVWFESDRNLLNEKISIQFKALPLEDGLKRILAPFDHALVFDAKGKLVGLNLLEKAGSDREKTVNRDVSPLRPPSQKTLGPDSGKTANAVNLPRPLPVKVIERRVRPEVGIEPFVPPDHNAEYRGEPEVKIRPLSPSDAKRIVPRPAPSDGSAENSPTEAGFRKGMALDAFEERE